MTEPERIDHLEAFANRNLGSALGFLWNESLKHKEQLTDLQARIEILEREPWYKRVLPWRVK